MWQPAIFVVVKTWNHESFSPLVVMTKWFRDTIPKASASFRYDLSWLWSSDKSPHFIACYSVLQHFCAAVKELTQHGSWQTNPQAFCLPLPSLTAAGSWALSFTGALAKNFACPQLSVLRPVTAEQRCPRGTREDSKGLRRKTGWRFPRGRLVIVH